MPDRIHRVTDDKIKELIDEFAAEPDRNKQLAIFDRLREILIKRRKDEKATAVNSLLAPTAKQN